MKPLHIFPSRPVGFSVVQVCTVALVIVLFMSGNLVLAADSARHKVLIASDIHFNPMADPSLVAQLAAAEPAQWEAILNKMAPHSFSPYGQDTNWWLLQSSLDQMHKTLPHPAVFFVLGDALAHHFPEMYRETTHDNDREHYRAFVLKTIQFLALQLRWRWPDTQILMTPGNADNDCGDYSIEAGGTFLSDTAATIRELAKADEQAAVDWKTLGSYTVMPAAIPGVKIVSFNSVFFGEVRGAKFQQFLRGGADHGAEPNVCRWSRR